jgi:hypothetical protein
MFVLGGDTYETEFKPRDLASRDRSLTHGYKNDVWVTEGAQWLVHDDLHLSNGRGQRIARQKSLMQWRQASPGLLPPPGVSYEKWLSCQPSLIGRNPDKASCSLPENQYEVHWSPRRHHSGVFFKGYLWVLGGRARESVELPRSRMVGGVIDPLVEDVGGTTKNVEQRFTNLREASVLKSDVWRSQDGRTWELVTPGCKAPQLNLVAAGNRANDKHGKESERCTTDEDCYGPSEKCQQIGADENVRTCVCQMWSPREQHQAAVYGDYMYVMGGYASRLFSEQTGCGDYACGDTDAGSYRYYMQDVWRSSDGDKWESVTLGTADGFPGRGGHQLLIMPTHKGIPAYFYIIGGRGGNPITEELYYYNDVWRSTAENPKIWEKITTSAIGWEPRTSHVALLETPSGLNGNTRSVMIYGGQGSSGSILDDVWTWRPDVPGDPWRRDFEKEELFRAGSATTFEYVDNSPAYVYVHPDANLSYIRRFWVPPYKTPGVRDPGGMRPRELVYLTDKKMEQLHKVGIYTIRQLANANKYQVLRLRGHDYPQVKPEDLMDFMDICDFRRLAEAIVDKCTVKPDQRLFDGQTEKPWTVQNVWGGAPPLPGSNAEWHNVDYNKYFKDTDEVTIIDQWDGCTYLPQLTLPNVIGLGKVSQVLEIRDPLDIVQELHCRFTPGRFLSFAPLP